MLIFIILHWYPIHKKFFSITRRKIRIKQLWLNRGLLRKIYIHTYNTLSYCCYWNPFETYVFYKIKTIESMLGCVFIYLYNFLFSDNWRFCGQIASRTESFLWLRPELCALRNLHWRWWPELGVHCQRVNHYLLLLWSWWWGLDFKYYLFIFVYLFFCANKRPWIS